MAGQWGLWQKSIQFATQPSIALLKRERGYVQERRWGQVIGPRGGSSPSKDSDFPPSLVTDRPPPPVLPEQAGTSAPLEVSPVQAGNSASSAVPPVQAGNSASSAVPPVQAGNSASSAVPPVQAGSSASSAVPPVHAGTSASTTVPPVQSEFSPETVRPHPRAGPRKITKANGREHPRKGGFGEEESKS